MLEFWSAGLESGPMADIYLRSRDHPDPGKRGERRADREPCPAHIRGPVPDARSRARRTQVQCRVRMGHFRSWSYGSISIMVYVFLHRAIGHEEKTLARSDIEGSMPTCEEKLLFPDHPASYARVWRFSTSVTAEKSFSD